MFRRFLLGFMSCFPFVSLSSEDARYFPEKIYRNDWKSLEIDIVNIAKTKGEKKAR